MSAQNIEARVARVIAEVGGLQQAVVKPDATLSTLGLDDLDEVEILMELEDEFGVTLPEDVAGQTVAEICTLVRNQMGAVA